MHVLALVVSLCSSLAATEGPYLFQQPTINRSHIVFVFAGDLWSVPRAGGLAIRLTTGKGSERNPVFSPDGAKIAFTGEYDGNVDVYTVPAAGGVPKRVTAHPAMDEAVGWTPDGRRVLFASSRDNHVPINRLFTVDAEGGLAEALPLPTAETGSYSPDGKHLAYLPLARADDTWKRYRGGRAAVIQIAKLADSSVMPIPRKDANDYNPMWIGNHIYFLSDRLGKVTLFRFDTKTKQVAPMFDNTGLDLKSAGAANDAIVYEQFGALHLFDLKTAKSHPVNVTLDGDLSEVRPRLEKFTRFIQGGAISPSGARAVIEARGEIFTVPAEKGTIRNLTKTPGVRERAPAWSPDGKWIAYLSDESGEYDLHIRAQDGTGEVRKIPLGRSWFQGLEWSPDSQKIAYTDKRLNLWYIDLERRAPVHIDTATYASGGQLFDPAWSPDSKWIAYAKMLRSHQCAIHLYSIETGKSAQITDGLSDARMPVFDRSGKYLYMAASTDAGPSLSKIDLSNAYHPVSRSVYVAVLSKTDPSPLAPESDEERSAPERKAEKPAEAAVMRIDFDDIQQRTIPLPMPARNFIAMKTGRSGVLYLLEGPAVPDPSGPPRNSLLRFDLARRRAEKTADDVREFSVSASGDKVLVSQSGQTWTIASAAASAIKPGEGRLKTEDIEAIVDPAAEWKQMYREVLRIQRDYFYDPNHHGVDLQALGERYEKYLRNLGSRSDLNYLWREMLGELTVGHIYVRGGDSPQPNRVRGGLLGADYRVENGRYRIARIYTGENWNPRTRAPLTQPGVNVSAGDYILAVNGVDLRTGTEIHAAFEGTADKSVTIRVAADPNGANARDISVTPIDSEAGLRRLAWVEGNRRRVEQLSGGQVAYVYLPDTSHTGYAYFNRYYFAQSDRAALVIDERYNAGGKGADWIIDHLRRPTWNYWTTREGEDQRSPGLNITGPKAMIVNEWAGSGGDALPWYFRRAGLGPLIGKRTWGGLVGISGTPELIDGGIVTSPNFAFWTPDGKWEIENRGTAPDLEVELDPKAWREGRDVQLEKAVEVVLEQLRKSPVIRAQRPPFPNYQPGNASNALPSGN